MGDDSIDTVILRIDMGYLVTLAGGGSAAEVSQLEMLGCTPEVARRAMARSDGNVEDAVASAPACPRFPARGLHSFTVELNLSNSRAHSWVTRWAEQLKLS